MKKINIMNKLKLSLVLISTILVQGAFAQCSDLFFSEYIEGSSSNKATEIYNPTSNPVNLSDYVIYRANNGSLTPTDSLFPQGILAANSVFIFANPSANAAIMAQADTTHTLTFYNGDDAVYLINKSTGDTLDILGEIGVDPGSGWPVGTGATNNFTLIRKFTIQQGQKNWTIGATEWDVFPIDMTDSLGSHSVASCAAQPISTTATVNNDVSCNGGSDGSITAVSTGGTSPYTFAWSTAATTGTITGLFAGTYTVTVTDNAGTTATSSASISQPTSLNATGSTSQNVSCNGGADGAASISGTGGTSPYTFLWSNAATTASNTGLAAGTYSVTITDANGCTAVSNSTITEPTALGVSISGVDVSTNGGTNGSAAATGSGGTPVYTFSWSNGATTANINSLAAGTYTLTLTDANGCNTSNSVLISQPTSINVSVTVNSNVSCNGLTDGSLTASATGGTTPFTYTWSNGATTAAITNLASGAYTVTVTDNSGSTSTGLGTITEPTALIASIVVDSNVSVNGGFDGGATASANGGTSAYTYTWSNSATTASITGVGAGTYSVTITDANGCTDSASVSITEPLAIVISGAVTDVSCNGLNDGSIDISVLNGQLPYSYLWSNGDTVQDITALAAGTYTVTVTDAGNATETQSFTVTEPIAISISVVVDSNATCNGSANGGLTATATGGSGNLSYAWNAGNKAIAAQSFESMATDNWNFTIAPATYNTEGDSIVDGSDDVWAVIEEFTGDIDTASNGLYFWGVQDINNANGGGAFYHTITMDPVDVSLETGVKLAFDYFSKGFDSTDELEYEVAFDNDTVWSSVGTALNKNTLAWTTVEIAVPDTTSFVRIRLQADQNGSSDFAGFDNIRLFTSSNSVTGLSAGSYTVIVTDANGCSSTSNGIVTEPAALTATKVVVDASAIGSTDGSIDLTVSGGTPAYTFSWSNGVTTEDNLNIAAGSYTVTITDANGCSLVDSATVQDPAAVFLSMTGTNVSCNGLADGTAMVSATGGATPFTYVWSPSTVTGQGTNAITGLAAGNYIVTVTDAVGTSVIDSILVVEPLAVVINLAVTHASAAGAFDGAIATTVVGGTSPFTYNWTSGLIATPNQTGLAAGNYCVTVTDANGCSAVACDDVLAPGVLAQLVVSEINYNGPESGTDTSEFIEFVNVGMSTVNLDGYSFTQGVTHTFLASDSITAGQYYVIAYDSSAFRNRYGIDADAVWNSGGLSNGGEDIVIIDNFGRSIDTVDFDDSAPWPAGAAAGGPDGGGASIELLDSTSNNNDGANWAATTNLLVGVTVNGFPVYGTPGSGPILVGVNERAFEENVLSIYPNPTSGLITIETKALLSNTRVQVLSIEGKILRDELFNQSKLTIDMNGFSNGIYFVRMGDTIQKLILNK